MSGPPQFNTREEQAEHQAEHCRVFSNARRVLILWALSEGERSVGEIAEAVGTTLQNISQHLHLMKTYHLVSSRRNGRTIYYALNEEVLQRQCQHLWGGLAKGLADDQDNGKRAGCG
jgi:ArsR family transcriptional regulator